LADCLHRITNPLAKIPWDTLLRDVAQFAGDNNLVDALPRLRKGALVAQDPGAYEELELDDDE
jgi:hypothetical protein